MKYRLLEPIRIGNIEIRNRIMYLAMAKYLCDPEGYITDRSIAYYRSLAEGGTGLIIPGAMIIDPEWPSILPMQPGLYDNKFIPGLRRLVEAVHAAGAKIFFQPWHPGAVPLTPGKMPKSVNELSREEILEIQKKFITAARLAKEAGADGIEHQICHNFIGAQFLSPHFNKRTDEYGTGSLENQLRFSLEILAGIRTLCGRDFPISIKLNGSDFVPTGITPELAVKTAPILEKAGAAMIGISGGGVLTGLTGMSADGGQPEGWKVPIARDVKEVVNIPVAAMDSIRHPRHAERYIQDGMCDLIGMGRGLLADHEWVNKVRNGKEDSIRHCISCMHCFNFCPPGKPGCSVNPFALREEEKAELKKDGAGRTVAVVGAGPAGLEAAVTLAERGFKCVIWEKTPEIGGAVVLAKKLPGKQKFMWQRDYYQAVIIGLDMVLKLGQEATLADLKALAPYAVVIATGSKELRPALAGTDRDNVLTIRNALASKLDFIGKNIVIIGAAASSLSLGEMLAENGNAVTIIEMTPLPENLRALPFEHRLALGKATAKGVSIKYNSTVLEIGEGEVLIREQANNETIVPADQVVLSSGTKPDTACYDQIRDSLNNVYLIGDAANIGGIADAVLAGSKLGYEL